MDTAEEIKKLRNELEELQKELKRTRDDQDDLKRDLKRTKADLADTKRKLKKFEDQINFVLLLASGVLVVCCERTYVLGMSCHFRV